MTKATIKKLRRRSRRILKELVTSRGIFASTDNGWKGAFHALFGRDSAITASLIFSAEDLSKRGSLSYKAYLGLLRLRKWQGRVDNPASGEETGKIIHEARATDSRNVQTRARLAKYRNLWFWDPKDRFLKTWDSVDSTPLWIITVIRCHKSRNIKYQKEVLGSLELGLRWCLENLKQYDGLAGFTGADLQPARTTTGMHNQGWKDNDGVYQYEDGTFAKHPIYDVFVNALFWAALKYGTELFEAHDPKFSRQLNEAADKLKLKFNSSKHGFLIESGKLHYFAEALDGDKRQLKGICADVGMCLWATYGNECIIDKKYIDDVVKRLMMPDMLNPEAGMRNYSSHTKVRVLFAGGYHRSQNTYWPFVSGLITAGLNNLGYKEQACQVAKAAINGIDHFKSCIEVFIEEKPNVYTLWQHPKEKQQSAVNQAWTAAAVYYMTSLLTQA